MTRKGWTAALILILIGLMAFFYLNPTGIHIGYQMAGGSDSAETKENPDAVLHDYYNEMDAYERYRESENPTARKWAEAAKQKAEFLAARYEQLTGIAP